MNNLKVFLLMAGMTGLLGAVGSAFGGQSGMVMALVLAAGMNLFAYFASAQMVLRMYGARVVCVTEGILRVVTPDELEGVLAHELAHVKNRDMLLMTVAATLAGAIANLAHFGIFFGGGRDRRDVNPLLALAMLLLAPLAAMLIQLAVSRTREFKADAVGAEISGRPLALANALRKLETAARRIPMEVSPAVAPLAQVNPLSATRGGFVRLFSTHPPMEERIARLEALANPA